MTTLDHIPALSKPMKRRVKQFLALSQRDREALRATNDQALAHLRQAFALLDDLPTDVTAPCADLIGDLSEDVDRSTFIIDDVYDRLWCMVLQLLGPCLRDETFMTGMLALYRVTEALTLGDQMTSLLEKESRNRWLLSSGDDLLPLSDAITIEPDEEGEDDDVDDDESDEAA